MKLLIAFLVFLAGSDALVAQKLAATIDKETILIGEPLQLRITASGIRTVEWVKMDSIPYFEILERSPIDSQVTDHGIELSQTLTLTSWDSGRQKIPSLQLGNAAPTKPILVNVTHTPMDYNQDYHDVKDILEVEQTGRVTWFWYLIALLLLVLLFVLFFPATKKKKADFVPDVSIYQKSLKRLEVLRSKKESEDKEFYTELVSIFREYLLKRKGIQSFSKTTDDLAVQLTSLQLQTSIFQTMLQELRMSDLVKFARYQPTITEKDNSISIIKQSIMAVEEAS